MSRFNEIYQGWKNHIFPTPELADMAFKRTKICAACEQLNSFSICSLCYCPVAFKVYSPDTKCKLDKWDKE